MFSSAFQTHQPFYKVKFWTHPLQSELHPFPFSIPSSHFSSFSRALFPQNEHSKGSPEHFQPGLNLHSGEHQASCGSKELEGLPSSHSSDPTISPSSHISMQIVGLAPSQVQPSLLPRQFSLQIPICKSSQSSSGEITIPSPQIVSQTASKFSSN